MNFKKSTSIYLILILAALAAAMLSGGCGGSSHHSSKHGSDEAPTAYRNDLAGRLYANSNVSDLAEFLNGEIKTVGKSDVLLYVLIDDSSMTGLSENTEYLTKINDALEAGAIVAFSNITAEEIDNIVNELGLNVPPYLPYDADDEEKKEIADLFAVAARADGVDSDDKIAVVDYYTFYGTDLYTPASMDIHVYSGDEEIAFNPGEYTASQPESVTYYIESEDRIVSNDPNPFNYDHVEGTVEDFMDWRRELLGMKSVNEVESAASTGAVRTAAGEANVTFPGVTASFNFVQNYAPRQYYITKALH